MVKTSPAVPLRSREIPATSEQLDIFTPPPPVNVRDLSIAERFELFHKRNPHVYRVFVQIARQLLIENKTKRGRIGAKKVWEEMRGSIGVAHGLNEAAAFDNSYVSRYARLAASQEPDLREAFQFRKLAA